MFCSALLRSQHAHDPHAGIPLQARPSLLPDSEVGEWPLDPTSDFSGTRLLLVNLKAALPGREAELLPAALADR